MSALLAIVESGAHPLGAHHVDRMLNAMHRRGDRGAVLRGDRVVLGTRRFDWEMNDGFAGANDVTTRGALSVVADASLYYRQELVAKLRAAGVRATSISSADLILAAYEAWGDRCLEHIEGDFAFVVYDARRSRVFAARDHMGRRPLFFATTRTSLIVASSTEAILAHPEMAREPDLTALVARISFALADETSSAYRGVSTVPAAHALTADGTSTPRVSRYWTVPSGDVSASSSFEDGVAELRELIERASLERMAPSGTTCIWLSGGYDSPSLFGITERALARRGDDRHLQPVSMSHPPEDPAREDELIDEVVGFWNRKTSWVKIGDAPLLENIAEHAAGHDDPFQHSFERWSRVMLAAVRRTPSHVVFTGDGGDQLFAVSRVFMHDLFARGQWGELHREWESFGARGTRAFVQEVVRPTIREVATRGRRVGKPQFSPPTWIRDDFVSASGLVEREWDAEERLARDGGSHARTETLRPLLSPVSSRVAANVGSFALDVGVEVRVPLLDRRIVEFAAGRPRSERASGGAVKHLLRAAASGALPDSVLSPRTRRTGALGQYFARGFRSDVEGVVTGAFQDSTLSRLGVVNEPRLNEAWSRFRQGGDLSLGFPLFLTLQVELWLRARFVTGHAHDRAQLAEIA
ncbi:MAG TPA: asparagine synthase-related protein [Gemmatimonadaceae bacterium]|nr:asparagine synthase-related protein [Gemmatimonadaceae bacterium]